MLVGHQKIWQLLNKLAEKGRLAHAYLFYGQEKIGKKTFALEFTKQLFRKEILKEFHPDFILIAPFPSEKEIKITQVKDLIWRLSLKPLEANLKVAIVDQAHCLNQEAQSALLKTLEEPPAQSLLILITEYPELLLPTILSRIQKIKFHPPTRKDIENYLNLKNFSLETFDFHEIFDFYQGKIGEIINLLNNPKKVEEKIKLIKELKKLISSPLARRFNYVNDLLKRDIDINELLTLWLAFFRREILKILLQKKENVFWQTNYSILKLKKILSEIQNITFLLAKTNINQRLALEKIVLEF
jgi:DNA polymerase-3 subunit delta'